MYQCVRLSECDYFKNLLSNGVTASTVSNELSKLFCGHDGLGVLVKIWRYFLSDIKLSEVILWNLQTFHKLQVYKKCWVFSITFSGVPNFPQRFFWRNFKKLSVTFCEKVANIPQNHPFLFDVKIAVSDCRFAVHGSLSLQYSLRWRTASLPIKVMLTVTESYSVAWVPKYHRTIHRLH